MVHVAKKDEAPLQWLHQAFPFPDYFTVGFDAHESLLQTVKEALPTGGKVLDIGCGPADKTAVLAKAGYDCTGYDDFQDPWHRQDDNFEKISTFAQKAGVTLVEAEKDAPTMPFEAGTFDLIMLNDIIEHLHLSPRYMLAEACRCLKTDGLLLVSVPNAVNIRKRLSVMIGKTNYPPYQQFFWFDGMWRGHVREYVRDDLQQLARYMGLNIVTLKACDHMISVLPRVARPFYKVVTSLMPSWKDSWLLLCRKPANWHMPAAPQKDKTEVIH